MVRSSTPVIPYRLVTPSNDKCSRKLRSQAGEDDPLGPSVFASRSRLLAVRGKCVSPHESASNWYQDAAE